MIKALDKSAAGLMKAQTRATELANDIVKTVSNPQPKAEIKSSKINVAAGVQTPTVIQSNSLIQQISEYKLTELQFRASATVFKRIADSPEATLGLLVDKKE